MFYCLKFGLFFQTNGSSNGLVPMLRVYNNTARYVDQGGNKVRAYKTSVTEQDTVQALDVWSISSLVQRPGAFAVYLEPWHADVFDFLELKKNTGKEEQRARDLFFALWIPDLFMKRVESNQVNAGGNARRRAWHFIINPSEANDFSCLPDIFSCKV